MLAKHDYTSVATPFLLVTPPFCVGIVAAGLSAQWWMVAAVLLVGLLLCLPFAVKGDFRGAICVMFAGLGFLNGSINLNFEPGVPIEQKREFISHIQSLPTVKGRYQKTTAEVLWMKDTVLGWQFVEGNCELNIDTSIRVNIGDIIVYGARSYAFDSVLRNYYFSQGLSARHYVYRADVLRSDTSFLMQVRLFRDMLAERISRCRDVDSQAVAVMQALTVGDKTGLDSRVKGAYRAAGASHLLAISGLHVGIIFAIVNFLLRGLNFIGDARWWRFGVMFIVLWGYALVSGMSASVVRAVIMFSFMQAGMVMGQRSGLNTLLIAAMLMLVYRAEYLWDVGFGLSYLAMVGITVLYKPISRLWRPKSGVIRTFWQVLVVSFSAQLFTMPLVAWVFGEVSLVGLGVNLVVWLFVPVIIVATLVYMVSGLWVIGWFGASVAWLQNWFMDVVGGVWWSTVDVGAFSVWLLCGIYCVLLGLSVWFSVKQSYKCP